MTPSKQKTLLITGGSRGIGKAIVDRFKMENWQVATCATSKDHLRESQADLNLACDVARVNDVKSVINEVVSTFGKIDALINNAGLSGSNSLDPDTSDELWHRMVDVNLNGTYYFCKYSAPW